MGRYKRTKEYYITYGNELNKYRSFLNEFEKFLNTFSKNNKNAPDGTPIKNLLPDYRIIIKTFETIYNNLLQDYSSVIQLDEALAHNFDILDKKAIVFVYHFFNSMQTLFLAGELKREKGINTKEDYNDNNKITEKFLKEGLLYSRKLEYINLYLSMIRSFHRICEIIKERNYQELINQKNKYAPKPNLEKIIFST